MIAGDFHNIDRGARDLAPPVIIEVPWAEGISGLGQAVGAPHEKQLSAVGSFEAVTSRVRKVLSHKIFVSLRQSFVPAFTREEVMTFPLAFQFPANRVVSGTPLG